MRQVIAGAVLAATLAACGPVPKTDKECDVLLTKIEQAIDDGALERRDRLVRVFDRNCKFVEK